MSSLTSAGGNWVREEALAGDASTRRYARLWNADGGTAVRARYPATDRHLLSRDLEVRLWYEGHGLRVPGLLEMDIEAGWAVFEDFGEADAETTLAATPVEDRRACAMRTIDPLATLADLNPAELPNWNNPLDRGRLRWELAGFELWFLRHLRNLEPPAAISRWLDTLADEIHTHPKRICHRDYHLNNLFLLADRDVGLIDFQDALIGPDTYDEVSLVEERAMPQLLGAQDREALRSNWAAATGAENGWRERWQVVRVQRGLKVLGTFARLCCSGRSTYKPWLELLCRDLARELAAVGAPVELGVFLLD